MIATESLAERLEAWDKQADVVYQQAPMPEVWEVYEAYRATGEYPYLAPITEHVMAQYQLPAHLKDKAHTQVYLASKQADKNELNRRRDLLTADGYVRITSANMVSLPNGRGRLYKIDIDSAFRPHEGRLVPGGFLPKGHSKRGILSTMLQLEEYWWKGV